MLKKIRARFRNLVLARLAPAIGRSFIARIIPSVSLWQDWDSTKCYYFGAGCNNWVQHDTTQFQEYWNRDYVVCDSRECQNAESWEAVFEVGEPMDSRYDFSDPFDRR